MNGRKIIINNDLDGLWCAYFLTKIYKCKVVGFTNSKDSVWLLDKLKGDEVFIDINVVGKLCIDQHILPEYPRTMLNPNALREKNVFDDYTRKYPFSCALFILAYAARNGYDISQILPSSSILTNSDKLKSLDLFLRADDMLMNSLRYKKNTEDWWKWLIEYSYNNEAIISLHQFVKNAVANSPIYEWKENVNNYLSMHGFKGEELRDFNEMEPSVIKKWFNYFNIDCCINNMQKTIMSCDRCNIKTKKDFEDFKASHNLYSFAFPYMPNNRLKNNFSYTLY